MNNKNNPSVNIGVAIFLISPDYKSILLGKRKVGSLYSQPGGWCELYEEWEECASRELYEECNLNITKERFQHIKTINNIDIENRLHVVVTEFICLIKEHEMENIKNNEPDKSDDWFWADMEFINKNIERLFLPLRKFVNMVKLRNISDFKEMVDCNR